MTARALVPSLAALAALATGGCNLLAPSLACDDDDDCLSGTFCADELCRVPDAGYDHLRAVDGGANVVDGGRRDGGGPVPDDDGGDPNPDDGGTPNPDDGGALEDGGTQQDGGAHDGGGVDVDGGAHDDGGADVDAGFPDAGFPIGDAGFPIGDAGVACPPGAAALTTTTCGRFVAGARLLTPRARHGSAPFDGMSENGVVVLGGYVPDGGATATVELQPHVQTNFAQRRALSAPRGGVLAVRPTSMDPEGAVLALGGRTGRNDAPTTPFAEGWQPGAVAPHTGPDARDGHAFTTFFVGSGTGLLVVGGRDVAKRDDAHWVYAGQDAWTAVAAAMNEPRAGHTVSSLGTTFDAEPVARFLVVGGGSAVPSEVLVLPMGGADLPRWELRDQGPAVPPAGLVGHAAVETGGDVLVVGGATDAGLDGACRRYGTDEIWRSCGALSVPRRDFTIHRLNSGAVLVVGGFAANGAPLSSTEVFLNGAWVPGPTLRTARGGHAGTVRFDGQLGREVLVVTGGEGVGGETLDETEWLDVVAAQ